MVGGGGWTIDGEPSIVASSCVFIVRALCKATFYKSTSRNVLRGAVVLDQKRKLTAHEVHAPPVYSSPCRDVSTR
jgi:hypothetical protein